MTEIKFREKIPQKIFFEGFLFYSSQQIKNF